VPKSANFRITHFLLFKKNDYTFSKQAIAQPCLSGNSPIWIQIFFAHLHICSFHKCDCPFCCSFQKSDCAIRLFCRSVQMCNCAIALLCHAFQKCKCEIAIFAALFKSVTKRVIAQSLFRKKQMCKKVRIFKMHFFAL